MSFLRVTAKGDGLMPREDGQNLEAALERIGSNPDHAAGPAVIMIHGFKYRPGAAGRCPHQTLFNDDWPDGWPARLGFGRGARDEGLGIAFGWDARCALWTARRRATQTAHALAQLVRTIRAQTPHRPVHVIAHSLGSAVALEALPLLAPGAINRIISLTGAIYASDAQRALASAGGKQTEFFNITSNENDLFEFLFERLVQPPQRGDVAMGHRFTAPNAVTVALDCPDTLDLLATRGAPIDRSSRRISHWSSYRRPGALEFYAQLLRSPARWPLEQVQAETPKPTRSRWSGLTALPESPLPFAQKTA